MNEFIGDWFSHSKCRQVWLGFKFVNICNGNIKNWFEILPLNQLEFIYLWSTVKQNNRKKNFQKSYSFMWVNIFTLIFMWIYYTVQHYFFVFFFLEINLMWKDEHCRQIFRLHFITSVHVENLLSLTARNILSTKKKIVNCLLPYSAFKQQLCMWLLLDK